MAATGEVGQHACPDPIRLTFASAWFRRTLPAGVAAMLRACINVSVSSVAGWSRRYKRTGLVRPDRMGRIRGSVPDGCRDWILASVRACPQITVRRLQALLAERGTLASCDPVWRALRSLGYTFKKKTPFADERDCPDAERPPRAVEAPSGSGGSAQAGLHRRDLRHDRINAPWVLDGPVNGDTFRVYVET